MHIVGLVWLDEIIDKLEYKHNVRQAEVAQVLDSHPLFRFIEKGHRPGENVYLALGQSAAGRYLAVFFVYKADQRALVVSARDMTKTERRQYGNG
jgi:uncharacterized DUF497 family protein